MSFSDETKKWLTELIDGRIESKTEPIRDGVNKICKGIECFPEIAEKVGKIAAKEGINAEDLKTGFAELLDERGFMSKAETMKIIDEKIPKPKVDAHDAIKEYKALGFINFCPECGDKLKDVPERYIACSDCNVPIAKDAKTAKGIKSCWNCGSKKAKEVIRKLKV